MVGVNPLGLSDEEFLNMNGPVLDQEAGEGDPSPQIQAPESEAAVTEETSAAGSTTVTEGEADGDGDSTDQSQIVSEAPVVEGEPAPQAEAVTEQPVAQTPAVLTPEQATEAYNKIMAPFKANGKMIELRSPEEAVSLMQMGANYTRKMQELQPHRKTLLMLQDNNLLDAEKLSFLIDLDKGDPEAIKKFIKDRNIDPLDIDTSTDPAYLGGTHQVTDEEAVFRSTLDELSSTPTGRETLQVIHGNWDKASKELLWQNPELLPVIQEQRDSGVYDAIVSEMDRQLTLGKLQPGTSFLENYRAVGDQLVAANSGHAPSTAPTTQNPVAPQVLATRAATPKSPLNNSAQVAAAAPSRGTATKAKEFVNPLAMSDEQFLKQMENRV